MVSNILNNYRPVSNLTFLSKVIKRAVAFHPNKYLINNNLNESLQPVYKSGHSTETAVVRVKTYIMISIEQGKPVILVLVDLSAAFDTVDHNVLFSRIIDIFGMSGKVLDPIWNNAPRKCLFVVFYLRFIFVIWSSGFHNVYPSSWDHSIVIWGYISFVC